MHHNRIATSRLPASLPCPVAIRFVLDDLNSTLSQEERRRLLHVSCLGQMAWRRGAPAPNWPLELHCVVAPTFDKTISPCEQPSCHYCNSTAAGECGAPRPERVCGDCV